MAWRGVAWRGVAWLVLGASAAAWAQPYGGPQFGGSGHIEFLTASQGQGTDADRVKALSASNVVLLPGQPAPPQTRQEAKFYLKANWIPAEGWGLAGFVWQYVWQPPGSGQQLPADALPIIAGQYSQFATGRAERPGVFWAKVGILRQPPGGQPETVPGVWLSAQCCAFGGPLALGVEGREPGDKTQTWLQIGRIDSEPNGANNNPWYLQYFGYSPSSPKPSGFQETQDAAAALRHSQPPGVEWEWVAPNGTYSLTLDVWPPSAPPPTVIDLQAEEAFEGREVRCLFYADVELQDGFQSEGSASTYPAGWFQAEGEDDTEQSHYEANYFTGLDAAQKDKNTKMVSKLTAAEPGELDRIENFPYDPSGNPFMRCGRKVLCQLKDTTGRLMPGVLCQERFPDPGLMPPGVMTNTEGQAWFTINAEGVASPNGKWDRYDELRYVWPPAPPYPNYAFPQQYWVATASLTSGGILKRSWTVTLTPGQPGTLDQDEN